MKICLINNLYEPYARGGAEKITATIAHGLAKSGHEIFIITTKPRGKLRITNYELRIYHLNSLYYNLNRLAKFLRFFWHLWNIFNVISYFKIRKIFRRERCDAVITNNLMGIGYLAPLAIKSLKLKHVHIVHDIQLIHPSGLLRFGQEKLIDSYFSRNYAGLTSRLFGSPRLVVFPSRWLRDRHLDKIFFVKSKRIILPNPIGPSLKSEYQKSDDIFKFLYLGQLEKHKGVNLLIQAFKKVREKFPRCSLVVAGSGAELARLKIQAGENSSIEFMGRQDEAQVDKLLKTCHLLVLPTLCYENCPSVILEAFSAGLPVLAADLGGVSELIGPPASEAGENAGLLFRPGNAADLADKMIWALENKTALAEMAKAGKEKAASFNVENYIRELERFIN